MWCPPGRPRGRRVSRPSTPSSSRCSATMAPGWSRWHGCSSTTDGGGGPRSGGLHPVGPQRLPDPGRGARRRIPALDRHQPGSRPQPSWAGVLPSPSPGGSPTPLRPRSTRPRPRSGGRWSKRCEALPKRQRDCVALALLPRPLDPRHRGNAWRVGELGQDTPAARTAVHGPDPGGEAMSAPKTVSARPCTTPRTTEQRSPSADLFHRVVDSIDADRRRRRRRRGVVLLWVAALAFATVAVLTLSPRNDQGVLTMPWWVLELATTAVLIAIALWLGPFIKRFGRALRRGRLPRQPADRARATSSSPTSCTT